MELARLRKERGLTQTKLAKLSGVSQTYISDLEANKKKPTVPIVRKLAAALEVTISELLGEDRPTGTEGKG